jgi:hypothetical protein
LKKFIFKSNVGEFRNFEEKIEFFGFCTIGFSTKSPKNSRKKFKKIFFLGIYPVTKSPFLGPKIFKDRQIIAQDRINVAMEMILNHNGSSKSYRDTRII